MSDTISVEVFDRDGVIMFLLPDGSEMRGADYMRAVYPDQQFDDMTAEPIEPGLNPDARPEDMAGEIERLSATRAYDSQSAQPTGYGFGDVGGRYGSDSLGTAYTLATGDGSVTRSMLPEGVAQYVPPAVGPVMDAGLAGLLGLVGGVEKGVGYGAEVVDAGARGLMDMLGMTPRYAPGTGAEVLAGDILGGLEVTGVGPEARTLGVLGRAAKVMGGVR